MFINILETPDEGLVNILNCIIEQEILIQELLLELKKIERLCQVYEDVINTIDVDPVLSEKDKELIRKVFGIDCSPELSISEIITLVVKKHQHL